MTVDANKIVDLINRSTSHLEPMNDYKVFITDPDANIVAKTTLLKAQDSLAAIRNIPDPKGYILSDGFHETEPMMLLTFAVDELIRLRSKDVD